MDKLNGHYSGQKTDNTVREIDVTAGIHEPADTWIAIGSEDRHVYIANFGLVLANNSFENHVKRIRVNGWIRSLAFCRDVDADRMLVAAGCGDKNLYFFNLDGAQVGEVFVDSKIHSIISDQRSSKLYCTSDAKKIYVIDWQGVKYGIVDELDLPHRATRLAFTDTDYRRIFAVCEDRNIYVFDTEERQISSWFSTGRRIFALKETSWNKTDFLMLGQAHGRLECYLYSITPEKPTSNPFVIKGQVQAFDANSLSSLAEIVLFGPKRQSIEVGIGRFLHLVESSLYNPSLCIVGMDGGDVGIIELCQDGHRQIVHQTRKSGGSNRVWAVFGYWEKTAHLHVYVATSEPKILQLVLRTDVQPPTVLHSESIELPDWPREIRPIDCSIPQERKELLVACENGDLFVLGRPETLVNCGQILRTGYARKVGDDEYEILTGSDNNLITFFKSQREIWKRGTLDKVREVLITENECLAVSEDRYLYVLDREGHIRFRYRFPHRALCLDRYFDSKSNIWFVVGCGDGYVYFVNGHGYVREAYEFPDRIRDVKIVGNEEIIVACEDRKVYFAPTMEKFFSEEYGERPLEFIQDKAKELQLRVRSLGLKEITESISEDERFLLLLYVNEWYERSGVEVVVSLLDSCKDAVISRDNLKTYYIYANALIALASIGEFAAAKSRIEKYIDENTNNSYALHSMLVTITQSHLSLRARSDTFSPILTIDVIVSRMPLDDLWILEECVRHLYLASFFSLTRGGFCQYFETVQIRYNRLDRIIEWALDSDHPDIPSSPLIQLVRFLREGKADRQVFENLMYNLPSDCDASVKECLEQLNFVLTSDDQPNEILKKVGQWIERKVAHQGMKKICKQSVVKCLSMTDAERPQFRLVAELMQNQLFRLNYLVTARDYFYVMFTSSFLWLLSDRSE